MRLALTLLALLALPSAPALAACEVGRLADLHVTMQDRQPMLAVKINGMDAQLVADSGAFWSVLTPASAAALNLKTHPAPFQIVIEGIGGTSKGLVTQVEEFELAGISLKGVDFVVGGNDPGGGAIGFLGQNILRAADVEYDLANGVIRLMRPKGCGKAMMAYWAGATQPYSSIEIRRASPQEPHTTGYAYVNGERIRVMFDTGAGTSVLTARAAKRAGIKIDDDRVVFAGFTRGMGQGVAKTYIAPFDSFRIGDEEVQHTKLRIGDLKLPDADMLIGTDFFLSHRLYVANEQSRLYFTFNGGPVFDLNTAPPETLTADAPTDAAGFARRGSAAAARRNFGQALADLTRAIELAPNEPQYYFDRGIVQFDNHQAMLAMEDFDRTLKLKPTHVGALVRRAELRLSGNAKQDALADLDAADIAAAREADIRLQMGESYARADELAPAIKQYTLWLDSHPADGRKAEVLNARCWARASLDIELETALDDCNAALKLRPNTPHYLDSRGLVRLRLEDYASSIADYDAVLKEQPKNAWSLYGRGVARIRLGRQAEGAADLEAAQASQPSIVEKAQRLSLGP